MKAAMAAGKTERHGIGTRLEYWATATAVPHMDESLFVPKTSGMDEASDGGRNTNNAGSWISPPPPTMESTKPAANAKVQSQKSSMARQCTATSVTGFGVDLRAGQIKETSQATPSVTKTPIRVNHGQKTSPPNVRIHQSCV